MLQISFSNTQVECGIDEAGRGPLAGPVVAAAVILPIHFHHPLLNDSKMMKEKDRLKLRQIIEQEAITWAVAEASVAEIDQINILQASFLAMHRAIQQLKQTPELLLVDGNRFKPYLAIPHKCIIKGDSLFTPIAAASVLAKTYRDELMCALALDYPEYGWEQNKGYPTSQHRKAIEKYGITIWHRKSYKLIPNKTLFD